MVFVTHSVFESVFLSNRIVVMAARPGRVFDEIAVDAAYPRDEAFRTSPDYAALCRRASDVLVGAINATQEAACMTAIERPAGALPLDPEEARRVRAARLERIGKWVLPLAIMVLAIWLWDRICVWNEIPQYILPRPGVVLETLYTDAGAAVLVAAGDAADHLPQPAARGRRRRRAGGAVCPVEMGRDVVLPLRRSCCR